MALVKCPRCELNYMNDNDEMCSVCRREVRGESESYDMIELCSECGENPVVPGYELCASCLKELQRRTAADAGDDVIVREDPTIGIDSVSTMDEIALDIDDDLNEAPFEGDEDSFEDEEAEGEEEEDEDEADGED
jgi:hypothetical protein